MSTCHIVVVVGSLRHDSFNRRLATAVARLAPAEFSFEQVPIGDLPLYNQDDDGHPAAAVVRLDGDAAAGRGPAPGAREGDFARLLRSREGHAAPPTLLRFYGDGGNRILSAGGAGDRSLRLFSCVRDAASRELSQKGAGNKRGLDSRAAALGVAEEELRLPRVVSMDASQVRERVREREGRGEARSIGKKREEKKQIDRTKSTVTLFPRETSTASSFFKRARKTPVGRNPVLDCTIALCAVIKPTTLRALFFWSLFL